MTRWIKKGLLLAMFGPAMLVATAASILIIWPLYCLFDWIDYDDPAPRRNFSETLGIWLEFWAGVRMAGES